MPSPGAAPLTAADNALRSCLAEQPHETVMMVTDARVHAGAEARHETAEALGVPALLLAMPAAAALGTEAPLPKAAAMAAASVSPCAPRCSRAAPWTSLTGRSARSRSVGL